MGAIETRADSARSAGGLLRYAIVVKQVCAPADDVPSRLAEVRAFVLAPAQAARIAATSSGAGGTPGTNHG